MEEKIRESKDGEGEDDELTSDDVHAVEYPRLTTSTTMNVPVLLNFLNDVPLPLVSLLVSGAWAQVSEMAQCSAGYEWVRA